MIVGVKRGHKWCPYLSGGLSFFCFGLLQYPFSVEASNSFTWSFLRRAILWQLFDISESDYKFKFCSALSLRLPTNGFVELTTSVPVFRLIKLSKSKQVLGVNSLVLDPSLHAGFFLQQLK